MIARDVERLARVAAAAVRVAAASEERAVACKIDPILGGFEAASAGRVSIGFPM